MEIENLFDFVNDKAIRLKNTRIGIETILREYHLGATPEEIVIKYPTLSLQQVYVTITYYLVNREVVDAYLERVRQQQEEAWKEQEYHPSQFVKSLRKRLDQKRKILLKKEKTASV